jgi:hypothetical protein
MRLRLVAFANLFPMIQIQTSPWNRHFDVSGALAAGRNFKNQKFLILRHFFALIFRSVTLQ